MRDSLKTFSIASAIVAVLVAAPTLHAHESKDPGGSKMSPGMMAPGMMGQGGMMGMMGQMSQMMEHCNQMMGGMMGNQGPAQPNEQWRRDAPKTPEKDG